MVSKERQKFFAELVGKFGPLTSDDLANRVNVKHGTTRTYLREAKKDGLVDRTGLGALVIWFAPKDRDRAFQIFKERKEQTKARKRAKAIAKRSWAEQRALIAKSHDKWAEAKPTHRRVPASEAKPIKILGPVSVFALGGML